MKKKIFTLGIAFSAILFASCGGIDSELDAYEKACEAKDIAKVTKALEALEKHDESEFTKEQLKRGAEIASKCIETNY